MLSGMDAQMIIHRTTDFAKDAHALSKKGEVSAFLASEQNKTDADNEQNMIHKVEKQEALQRVTERKQSDDSNRDAQQRRGTGNGKNMGRRKSDKLNQRMIDIEV